MDGRELILLVIVVSKPRQRGLVNGTAWRSGEYDDPQLAVVDLQHMSDSSDVEVPLEGVKVGLSVYENTTVFERLGALYPPNPTRKV